jgi:hypothetical protein
VLFTVQRLGVHVEGDLTVLAFGPFQLSYAVATAAQASRQVT